MECPTCHSTDVHSRGKRYAIYPAGPVAIFGLALAMLHQVSAPTDYQCKACGLDFALRTKFARAARVILLTVGWLLAIVILLAILAVILRH